MGYGSYSSENRHKNATMSGFYSKSLHETFSQTKTHNDMDPKDAKLREARDNEEHPNSFPIIIALDVTGSMGRIPELLVKDGLPDIMTKIIQKGAQDAQLMFLAVGDHTCDSGPLQVSQFESSDELLDKWLTSVWLEGGGGANIGESYFLAWYFAGRHVVTDAFEKRGTKGVLITIGDEPCLPGISGFELQNIMGEGQYKGNYTSKEMLESAQKLFHVYHINVEETLAGSSKGAHGWSNLIGQNLLTAKRHSDVPGIIIDTVLKHVTYDANVDTKVDDILIEDKKLNTHPEPHESDDTDINMM